MNEDLGVWLRRRWVSLPRWRLWCCRLNVCPQASPPVVTATQVIPFLLPRTPFSPVSNLCAAETAHPSSVLELGGGAWLKPSWSLENSMVILGHLYLLMSHQIYPSSCQRSCEFLKVTENDLHKHLGNPSKFDCEKWKHRKADTYMRIPCIQQLCFIHHSHPPVTLSATCPSIHPA